MVELKGTEKQIKYANDIREKLISLTEEAFEIANNARIEEKGIGFNPEKPIYKHYKNFIESIENEDLAKNIIENFKFVLKDMNKYLIFEELIRFVEDKEYNRVITIFNKAKKAYR